MKNEFLKWAVLILGGFGFLYWLSKGDFQYLIILVLFLLIFVAYESGISVGKKARDEEIEDAKYSKKSKKK